MEKKESQKKHVRLFTQDEVDEAKPRMTFMYHKGFELGDDVLEIIVRDHEPVQIWAISDEEAEVLAEAHLHRAMHEEEAARSARIVLDVYDRIYFYMIVGPRMKATYTHVRKHGGLSFK